MSRIVNQTKTFILCTRCHGSAISAYYKTREHSHGRESSQLQDGPCRTCDATGRLIQTVTLTTIGE